MPLDAGVFSDEDDTPLPQKLRVFHAPPGLHIRQPEFRYTPSDFQQFHQKLPPVSQPNRKRLPDWACSFDGVVVY